MNNKTLFSLAGVKNSFLLLLLPFITSFFFYHYLPDRMAIHLNELGQPDNYLPKILFLLGIPTLGVFFQLYRLSRLKNDPVMNYPEYPKINLSILLFPIIFDIAYFSAILYNLEVRLNYPLLSFLIIGVLFIIIGVLLPEIPRNTTLGKFTYWINPYNERGKSIQLFTAFIWTISGLCVFILGFTNNYNFIQIVVVISTISPVIYSLFIYKKLK